MIALRAEGSMSGRARSLPSLVASIVLGLGMIVVLAEAAWVGLLWLATLVGWLGCARSRAPQLRALSPAFSGAALGFAPQVIMLTLFNGVLGPHALGIGAQGTVARGLIAYENAVMWLHDRLKPVEELDLLIVAAVVLFGAIAALGLGRPRMLTHLLGAYDRVSRVVYVVMIATSYTLCTAVPSGNWNPEAESRIAAEKRKQLQTAAAILIEQEMIKEIAANPPLLRDALDRLAAAVKTEHEAAPDGAARRAGMLALAKSLLPTAEVDVPADETGAPDRSPPLERLAAEEQKSRSLRDALTDAGRALSAALLSFAAGVALDAGPAADGGLAPFLGEAAAGAGEWLAEDLAARVGSTRLAAFAADAMGNVRRLYGKSISGFAARLFASSVMLEDSVRPGLGKVVVDEMRAEGRPLPVRAHLAESFRRAVEDYVSAHGGSVKPRPGLDIDDLAKDRGKARGR